MRFAPIDLSRLPVLPKTAQTFDTYYADYMADLTARLNAVGIPYNVGSLETDTYAITGEAYSYRTTLVAQSIDDAIAAVLLPTSYGAYLDNLGATQDPPVTRNTITPASGTTPAVMEEDDPYRQRIALAPNALSTCGPELAYVFFAVSVSNVAGVGVYGPMSFGGMPAAPFTPLGQVNIPVMSGTGDGTAPATMVAAVQAAVSGDQRRPIGDYVVVSAATILDYTINALLLVGAGADPGTVLLAAYARARAAADLAHRPGGQMLDQDLYAALKVPDKTGAPIVGKVVLNGWADVNGIDPTPAAPAPAYVAPYCAQPSTGALQGTVQDLVAAGTITAGSDAAGNSYLQLVAGGITLQCQVVND